MSRNFVLVMTVLCAIQFYSHAVHIPFPWEAAKMARYVVHNTDWVAVSTISTINEVKGYPFVNLLSMSDGPVTNGSGVPYIYMTGMDTIGKDILKDNRASLMTTLAENDYCKQKNYDPEDPRCVRIFLTGKIVKVQNHTAEYAFAKNALFSRHPIMPTWPTNHNFYFAKLNIEYIGVFDYFGGVKVVSVEDYFKANYSVVQYDIEFQNVEVIAVDV